ITRRQKDQKPTRTDYSYNGQNKKRTNNKLNTHHSKPSKSSKGNTRFRTKPGHLRCCQSPKELESHHSCREPQNPRPVLKTSVRRKPTASPKTSAKTKPLQQLFIFWRQGSLYGQSKKPPPTTNLRRGPMRLTPTEVSESPKQKSPPLFLT
ncbi:unnamed protein product, partial [Microthlaspi erraticum]